MKFFDLKDGEDVRFIKTNRLAVLDFWGEWCAPCLEVEEKLKKFNTGAKVGRVNVDACPRSSNRWKVRSLPTLVVFRDGGVVDYIAGNVPNLEERLLAKLKSKGDK